MPKPLGHRWCHCRCHKSITNPQRIVMNTLSGSTIIVITSFLFLFSNIQPVQADDRNQQHRFWQEVVTPADSLQESQRPGQRGMFQPRDNRLVFQLDDLSEEQREQITALGREHREKILELRSKMRSGEISRESIRKERRDLYESHQQELREVLTKEQWEHLKELRAERRRPGRNG